MVRIVITGDICPINRVADLNEVTAEYELFHNVHPILKTADYVITNLECPLIDDGKPIKKTGPVLKAPSKTVSILKTGNVSLVTLANNHIMDYDEDGLLGTMELLSKHGISYVGAGKSLEEARKCFRVKIKGKRIAFINIAENEFSTTHGKYPGTNPLSLISNKRDIQEAKKKNDFVIVVYHGGHEEYSLPSPRIRETFRFFVECGASAVVCHHSHRYSGYEYYQGAPILYGLGNFLFDYKENKNHHWQQGLLAILLLNEKSIHARLVPISQFDKTTKGVRMLLGQERKAVLSDIERINEIIRDDCELVNRFQEFIRIKEKQYQHFMEPYTSRILHGLRSRRIIPTFLSIQKRRLYLNLIRCESHRDIIMEILDENRYP